MSIRVLLADDDPLLRAGYRMLLEAEPGMEVAGEARDGREAVEAALRMGEGVVLMDIRMPELNGIEATQEIMAAPAPRPFVLVLSTFESRDYLQAALDAGASGFLNKGIDVDDLLGAIRRVAAGERLG
jgi:DNA-binding NarL/FixJ family response regulator